MLDESEATLIVVGENRANEPSRVKKEVRAEE